MIPNKVGKEGDSTVIKKKRYVSSERVLQEGVPIEVDKEDDAFWKRHQKIQKKHYDETEIFINGHRKVPEVLKMKPCILRLHSISSNEDNEQTSVL